MGHLLQHLLGAAPEQGVAVLRAYTGVDSHPEAIETAGRLQTARSLATKPSHAAPTESVVGVAEVEVRWVAADAARVSVRRVRARQFLL